MSIVINVSHNGFRLFSTSRGSCRSREQALLVLAKFAVAFPESAGYHVSAFRLVTEATELDIGDSGLSDTSPGSVGINDPAQAEHPIAMEKAIRFF